MRMPLLAAALFCFWLVLSGHWDAWLVLSGLCLSVLTAVFCQAKGLVDAEGFPYGTLFRNALYWPWLIWQIALSALNVTKIILDPRLPITPSLVRVRALQKSPLGMTIYANSITLTPGTISVEICENEHLIWVHAIEKAGAEGFADDEMNRRVAWVDEARA